MNTKRKLGIAMVVLSIGWMVYIVRGEDRWANVAYLRRYRAQGGNTLS